MSREKRRLASFCRLCLIKTDNKVQLFGHENEENLMNLLKPLELDIDPAAEPDAIACYDCTVTLEGFQQFKEQCHANDEYLKALPPKDSADGSEASGEELNVFDGDYLLEGEEDQRIESSEEEGRVEEDDWYVEPATKKISKESSKVKRAKSIDSKHPEPREDPLDVRQSGRVRKSTPKVQVSSISPDRSIIEKPKKRQKLEPLEIPEPSTEDLQPLKDSYPDYFHFEKSPRSLYYTLVYYGERFNSAIFSPNQTYWQCAYKRKFHCSAVVTVSNDYTNFERRYKHTHGDQKESGEFELFTPRQALPEVFRIAWLKLMEKKLRREQVAAILESSKKRKREKEKQEEQEQQEPIEEVELIEDYEEDEPEEKWVKNASVDEDEGKDYIEYSDED